MEYNAFESVGLKMESNLPGQGIHRSLTEIRFFSSIPFPHLDRTMLDHGDS